MKKTLVLPTTPTTGALLDLPAEGFEDALVVVCVMLSRRPRSGSRGTGSVGDIGQAEGLATL